MSAPRARNRAGLLYRLFLSLVTTRARLAGVAAFGAIAVVVGLVIGRQDASADQLEGWTQFANGFGLSLYVPIAALLFASAALGSPAEDGTLVYLWLRPTGRLELALTAYLAALTIVVPMVVLPLVIGGALSGGGGQGALGAASSAAVGAVAYCAVFCWLGLSTRRALAWGLAYVLIWEGFVAAAGGSASRLAVRAYTRSILSEQTGVDLPLANVSPAFAIAIPLVVAVAGIAATTARLDRADVA